MTVPVSSGGLALAVPVMPHNTAVTSEMVVTLNNLDRTESSAPHDHDVGQSWQDRHIGEIAAT
ncbi:hypothetical protein SAMN05421630_101412 [Prauserella marina]|uniref:Uncharacterized protein n=1 Tax=Prauserella marina TaxID=530584 RepID=A0A1G6ITT2_9PSEU|nr:hypothetical protein DES30_101925 [Prauserella marina]SDC09820.1 hypothetical protein SAMN05421630_101412 [Prauserella marina]